jgi:hypothetical protein
MFDTGIDRNIHGRRSEYHYPLTGQLSEYLPDPAVCTMNEGRRLSKHENALAAQHRNIIFLAITNRLGRL